MNHKIKWGHAMTKDERSLVRATIRAGGNAVRHEAYKAHLRRKIAKLHPWGEPPANATQPEMQDQLSWVRNCPEDVKFERERLAEQDAYDDRMWQEYHGEMMREDYE